MAAELVRVVVVSREPVPVTTVLRFKVPGCLPVAVPTVDQVASKLGPEAIVLLDLGEGGANLAAARRLRQHGVRHGIVMIGNAGTGGLAGVSSLQPPFQLDELSAAMQRAREHSARAAAGQEELSESTVPAAEPSTTPGAAEPDEQPVAADPAAEGAVTGRPGKDDSAVADRADKAKREPSKAPPTTKAGPPIPPAGPAEPVPGRPAASTSSASQPDRGRAPPPSQALPPPSGPAPTPTPVRREATTAVPQVAIDAVTSVDESLFSSQAPAHPGGRPSGSGAPGEPLRSKVDRWRRKLSAPPAADGPDEPTERELHERLVQIFAATSQIESIAAELPIVTDRAALYQAIVMAVADEFAADSVVLWRRAHNGWVAAAHRGLTGREASLPVGFEQPVLRDVDARTGAILLDPTVSFQNLISGIGGAHTESFMAASTAIGSNRLGILAVGRDEPLTEPDLDRLVEMAVEAAVGIGVAEHIERMSALVGRMGGKEPARTSEPGQWREEFLDELDAAWHERSKGDAAEDPAAAAGLWSALASPEEQDDRGVAAPADSPDTVIDLTHRATKRA